MQNKYSIPAKPTIYSESGEITRSQIEAQWIKFFEYFNIKVEYESLTINGKIPDLYFPEINVIAEIKPIDITDFKTLQFEDELKYKFQEMERHESTKSAKLILGKDINAFSEYINQKYHAFFKIKYSHSRIFEKNYLYKQTVNRKEIYSVIKMPNSDKVRGKIIKHAWEQACSQISILNDR
jgi:hypothetical protein